MLTIQNERK